MRAWGAFAASATLHALVLGLGFLALEQRTRQEAPTLRVTLNAWSGPVHRPAAPGSGDPRVADEAPRGPSRAPTTAEAGLGTSSETTIPPETTAEVSAVTDVPGLTDDTAVGLEPAPPEMTLASPDRPAQLVSEVHPRYPREARTRGWEGDVVLGVAVGVDGSVTGVEVRTSSGRATLDRAASEAVRGAHFHPAMLQGDARPDTVVVTVRFRLQ